MDSNTPVYEKDWFKDLIKIIEPKELNSENLKGFNFNKYINSGDKF